MLVAAALAATAAAPNIVVLLTDDQDVRLGSMAAMPYTAQHVGAAGANVSNFFVNTPICCPSRATLLSGRWNHNNKVKDNEASGCMRMNTSRVDNPQWWENSFVSHLHKELGYTTGLFGKVLNDMTSYGCSGAKTAATNVDRAFIMCNPAFYDETWADFGGPDSPSSGITKTGRKDTEYTTSLIGNATLEWVKGVAGGGKPFFAWIGPHAPHLPSTPAAWYENDPVGDIAVPKEIYYNYSSTDKHSFIATEPVIDEQNAASIRAEHSKRLRSLLSVDDVVRGLHQHLQKVGEWSRTFWLFTSDHGYSLGQFRIDSHKTQVYDHNTRVPMLISGPGVSPGSAVDVVTSMADLAPTVIELAGGKVPAAMDGTSFAPQLLGQTKAWPRTATLIEYQSIRTKDTCELSAGAGNVHFHDGPNNTFAALRILGGGEDLLYAEFTNVDDPLAWDFDPARINYYELYNVTEDYYMLRNVYQAAPAELKKSLHTRLHKAIKCSGAAECNAEL
eukprot:TRINITY_DN2966_c0_g1_i1.p1 TRINITY_DN2966_c0_g1~~TRINITY_DN2966_c0_g1_i1.p1  ORF type:complete len:503 (+),score=186.63 TRINITY_DN2966_c0_g1_i1:76-1584(+)